MPQIPQISGPFTGGKTLTSGNNNTPQNAEPFSINGVNAVQRPSGVTQKGDASGSANQGIGDQSALPPGLQAAKDPSMAVETLHEVFSGELLENAKLNGYTELVGEIDDLTKAIYINPDKLMDEILTQEKDNTVFAGNPLFEILRELCGESSEDTKELIANLLKTLNYAMSRNEILSAVKSNIKFLAEYFGQNTSLSKSLYQLYTKWDSGNPARNFESLKNETAALMRTISGSLQNDSRTETLVPLVTHNLSRYNTNEYMMKEAFTQLMSQVPKASMREGLSKAFTEFVTKLLRENTNSYNNNTTNPAENQVFRENFDVSAEKAAILVYLSKLLNGLGNRNTGSFRGMTGAENLNPFAGNEFSKGAAASENLRTGAGRGSQWVVNDEDLADVLGDNENLNDALRGDQQVSNALRGSQEPSDTLRDGQQTNNALRGNQEQSDTLRDGQQLNDALRGNQEPNDTLRDGQQLNNALQGDRGPNDTMRGGEQPNNAVGGNLEPNGALRGGEESNGTPRSGEEFNNALRGEDDAGERDSASMSAARRETAPLPDNDNRTYRNTAPQPKNAAQTNRGAIPLNLNEEGEDPERAAAYRNTVPLSESRIAFTLNNFTSGLTSGRDAIGRLLALLIPRSDTDAADMMQTVVKNTASLTDMVNFLNHVLENIPDIPERQTLCDAFETIVNRMAQEHEMPAEKNAEYESETVKALTSFIERNVNHPAIRGIDNFNASNLLQSILNAPGVFTPLAHYIIPLQVEDTRAFGELWVDNDNTSKSSANGEKSYHLFLTFDVEAVGRFEVDAYSTGKELNLSVLYPKSYRYRVPALTDKITRIAAGVGFNVQNFKTGILIKPHTLAETFPRITENRRTFDVKA